MSIQCRQQSSIHENTVAPRDTSRHTAYKPDNYNKSILHSHDYTLRDRYTTLLGTTDLDQTSAVAPPLALRPIRHVLLYDYKDSHAKIYPPESARYLALRWKLCTRGQRGWAEGAGTRMAGDVHSGMCTCAYYTTLTPTCNVHVRGSTTLPLLSRTLQKPYVYVEGKGERRKQAGGTPAPPRPHVAQPFVCRTRDVSGPPCAAACRPQMRAS